MFPTQTESCLCWTLGILGAQESCGTYGRGRPPGLRINGTAASTGGRLGGVLSRRVCRRCGVRLRSATQAKARTSEPSQGSSGKRGTTLRAREISRAPLRGTRRLFSVHLGDAGRLFAGPGLEGPEGELKEAPCDPKQKPLVATIYRRSFLGSVTLLATLSPRGHLFVCHTVLDRFRR
ncbi:LAMI_0C06370g1_1 [Lachancea mirantina]|uniref:LAMI_0C06370g1_1 n=1 Tax=Lachancea mirantina TaxID=1230905 RepID=A0A1G4J329_9SACH|nr:LAMI_0C06370g1_1 [Lachancea mirantina]